MTMEESGGSWGERWTKRLYARRGDWKTSSGSTGPGVGSACRLSGDGESMGVSYASRDDLELGGVRWNRG